MARLVLLLSLLVAWASAGVPTNRIRCCRKGCGAVCYKGWPLQKVGSCPPPPKYVCALHPLPDPCKSNDFNCPGRQKCCAGGCGTACVKPRFTLRKPGRCPPPPKYVCALAPPLPDPCKSNDFNCPGRQKCCVGGCGTACVEPRFIQKPRC